MPRRNSKFPHVSLYVVAGTYRLTTAKIEGRRITRRLGTLKSNAERYAAKVSDWIDQWKSSLMPTAKLLQLLGETLPIRTALDRYKAKLISKKRKTKYVEGIVPRIARLCALADITRVSGIQVRAVQRALEALRVDGVEGRDGKAKPVSDQTIRHYARAMQQFSKFCWKSEWLERDPLIGLDSVKVNDIKRQRRAPTALELRLLISHVETMPLAQYQMIGIDRAMVYCFAIATGLRAGELRETRASWLDLDKALMKVPGKYTKNSKDAVQPLPAWLVAKTRTWLTVAGDRRLWPTMPKTLVTALRADQLAARKAWIESAPTPQQRIEREKSDTLRYKTDAGYFDFHCLRHAYVTNLVSAGTNVKAAQTLARHSSAELTIGLYSHSELEALKKHVDAAIVDPLKEAPDPP